MDTLLKVRDLLYSYNGRTVLAIPELEISRASIIGLAGPNGSGKTTLLKLLSCVVKPTTGSVSFHDATALPEDRPIRHKICLLPQESYLLRRTVYENIAYGLRIRGIKEDLDSIIHDAIQLVGLSQSFAGRQWHELSGGEAQRVALAARLALKPDCLLLDEPTASVDMESARCIRRAVLLARKEWGTTLIIASHHRSWLNDICDRIIYLYNGRVMTCSYENILTGPWEANGDSLVSCQLSDGQKMYVVKPFQGENNAVIAPEALKINSIGHDTNVKTFQAVISSITMENYCDGPQVYVTCGDQRFIVSVSEESLESENYRPGQHVILHYDPEEIIWLDN